MSTVLAKSPTMLRLTPVLLALLACAEADVAPAEALEGGKPPPASKPPEGGAPAPESAPPPGAAPAPEAAEACGDVPELGRCEGDVVSWCSNGEVRTTDCAAVGERCGWVSPEVGFYCGGDPGAGPAPEAPPAAEPCGDVDYLGRCEGAVALYCHDGVLGRVDCGRWGQPCGWVDDRTGYY